MNHRDQAIRNNQLIEMWVVEEQVGTGATTITHGVHPTEDAAQTWCHRQQLLTPDVERVFLVVPRVRDGWKIARTPEEVQEVVQGLDRAIQVQEKLDAEIERVQQANPNITDEDLVEHVRKFAQTLDAEVEVA